MAFLRANEGKKKKRNKTLERESRFTGLNKGLRGDERKGKERKTEKKKKKTGRPPGLFMKALTRRVGKKRRENRKAWQANQKIQKNAREKRSSLLLEV